MSNGDSSCVSGSYVWTADANPDSSPHAPAAAAGPSWLSPWFLAMFGAGGGVFARPSPPSVAASSPHRSTVFSREELRLDVDGLYPQMVVSGTATAGLSVRVEWIANLDAVSEDRWIGSIWYKNGDADKLPYTSVEIDAGSAEGDRTLTVTYSDGVIANRTTAYRFESSFFRRVEFEIDEVEGADGVTSISTGDHPDHPPDLTGETLSVDDVFQRAGFEVRRTHVTSIVPLAAAHANRTWDDAELHDAMQTYWSRFSDSPQWSMWALFAARHDQGRGLGGVMFDDIGPNHRQGVAVFTDTVIARPPDDDPNGDAWTARMKLFTLVHEMGHAFNMAHSWQKSMGTPWISVPDEAAERSFMNYPQRVSENTDKSFSGFFSGFRYRFSDSELLFMRHAPERFVQMGGADWFDDHGFRQATISDRPAFRLELRIRPEKEVFEYLEPIVLELKLTNVSGEPQHVPSDVLSATDSMTVILKHKGKPARRWAPFARYCVSTEPERLAADESRYASLFVSAGQNGWDIADPGVYTVQLALGLGGEDVVSNALQLKVAPPRWRNQEVLAQDYFSEDVGRVLAMNGSSVLSHANDTLRELTSRYKSSKATFHARLVLASPLTKDFKRLLVDEKTGARKLDVGKAAVDAGRAEMDAALITQAKKAMETLGHIAYNKSVQRYCDRLENWGDAAGAETRLTKLLDTLSKSRSAGRRPVVQSVRDAIAGRIQKRRQRTRGAKTNEHK